MGMAEPVSKPTPPTIRTSIYIYSPSIKVRYFPADRSQPFERYYIFM